MDHKKSLVQAEIFEKYRKSTWRELFLESMNKAIFWTELCPFIAPFYPRVERGRPPRDLKQMLRIHFPQNWFNLSDKRAEEALYDNLSMRAFAKERSPNKEAIGRNRGGPSTTI